MKKRRSHQSTNSPIDEALDNIMLVSFGLNFKVISANSLFSKALECSASELTGKHFNNDLCEETADYVKDEITYLLKQGKLWQGSLLISGRKHATPIWFSGTIIPVKGESETVFGYTLIASKGKTQNDLISSHGSTESWMKAIFNNPEEANVLINNEGEVIDFNAKAKQFMEWYAPKEMALDELIWDYFDQSFSKTFQAFFDKSRSGQRQKFIKRFKNISGYSKVADIELRPVISQKHDIMGVIMIITDISEEVAMENRVRLSEKRLDEIAFINAHEVRAPLASILGLLNLLDFEEVDSNNKQILSYLKKAANELEVIIHKVSESTYLDNEQA